jgi:hypothetical protein
MKKIFFIFLILFSLNLFSKGCVKFLGFSQEFNLSEAQYKPENLADIKLKDNYLYILDTNSIISVFDVSDPLNPVLINIFNPNYLYAMYGMQMEIIDNILYVVYSIGGSPFPSLAGDQEIGPGLWALDISNPYDMKIIGLYKIQGCKDYCCPCAADFSGNYAFLVGTKGIDLLDISELTNIKLIYRSAPSYWDEDYDVMYDICFDNQNGSILVTIPRFGLRELSFGGFEDVFEDHWYPYYPHKIECDDDDNVYFFYNGYFYILPKHSLANAISFKISLGYQISLYPKIAFLGQVTGFKVLNIEDKTNIFEVGSYELADKDFGYKIVSNGIYAFTAIFSNEKIKFGIFDVSTCEDFIPERVFIPAVANSIGAYGTYWKSDVYLYNNSSRRIELELKFLEAGKDNTNPITKKIELEEKSCFQIDDILYNLFGLSDTYGSIIISSKEDIYVSSRTYNSLGDLGTYGQYIDGYKIDNSITEEGKIIGLKENNAFRTNLGLLNLNDKELKLNVSIYSGDGGLLGELEYNLKPYEFFQENSIIRKVTLNEINNSFIIIKAEGKEMPFFAYSSVVDNKTGDGIFIPAKK